MTAPPTAGRDRFDWYLIVPVIGPALLLLARNADFMFDPPGWIDTFAMVGRFWHYTEHDPLFDQYKSSRLPWILPGFVAHQLLGPVTGSYVLHTAVLLASSIAVYLFVRDTLSDRPVASVTAAAWSTCTWLHGNGGWNYHVGAAAGYYMWALWMLARSTRGPNTRWWLAGAGAAIACAIHTHTVFAAFVPIAALLYVAGTWGSPHALERLIAAPGYVTLGGATVTALLAIPNVATGGEWLFFLPQIQHTLNFARDGNRWVKDAAEWLPAARYLVIPSLIVLGGMLWLVLRFRTARQPMMLPRSAGVLVWQGILSAALMCYFQFVGRQTMLDWSYFTVPLYCHLLPMLGVLLWGSRPSAERRDLWLTIASALIIVAPLLLLLPQALPRYLGVAMAAVSMAEWPIPFAAFAAGVGCVSVLCVLRGWARIAAFAICYGVLNAWLAGTPGAYGIGTPGINRDMLIVFRSLDRYTAALDPSLFAIRFWGEPGIGHAPQGTFDFDHVFKSFLAIRRRSLITAAYDRPGIRADELVPNDLYSSQCLGVLSAPLGHDDLVNRIRHRFNELGAPLWPVGRHVAESGGFSVSLTVLSLRPPGDPRPGILPCPPSR